MKTIVVEQRARSVDENFASSDDSSRRMAWTKLQTALRLQDLKSMDLALKEGGWIRV